MSEFNSSPNQKRFLVKKTKDSSQFGVYDKEAMFAASRRLTDKTFKLWCYLNSNKDQVELYLSKSDFMSNMGGNKSSYDRAVKELIEYGYLVLKEGNLYYFYESLK